MSNVPPIDARSTICPPPSCRRGRSSAALALRSAPHRPASTARRLWSRFETWPCSVRDSLVPQSPPRDNGVHPEAGLCKTLHSGQAGEMRGSHIASHTNPKEKSKETSMTEPSLPQPPTQRRGRWGIIAVVLAAFVAGSFGTFVTHSFGQGFGPPWMGPMTPAQIEDRADRMVRHLAIEIDATTDQQG